MATDASEIDADAATQLQEALATGHGAPSAPRARLVAARVALAPDTWRCPVTDARQRLVALRRSDRKRMHTDVLALTADREGARATARLELFSDWLE
jgi:hypothetical protein